MTMIIIIITIIESVVNSDCDDDGWFLGFDEKESDVYMKHCTVLIEPIAESMRFYISMQKVRISRKV